MFAIVTGLLLAAVPSASATTFTVTNALPQGPGSLRDAVEQSNFDILSSNTVVFAIPGTGPHTITLTSATGNTIAVTAPVVIDGTTQDGYQPWRPAVKIFVQEEAPENFTGLGCMALFNGSVTVRGLTFESRNSVELQLSREGGDRVEACVFGSEDGQESPYAYPCISMYETRGSVVGSAAPGMGNIFKTKLGNTISMYRVQDTVVIGNYFGIDPLTAAVYRCGHTIIRMTDTLNCRVGGAALGERNIIAAGTFAVSVAGFPEYGGGSEGNTVIGNYIGTDASGTSRTGLVGTGIEGLGAQNLRVGGAAPGEGNVIVAGNRGLNTGQCVLIHQVSSDAVVQGNIFGLASDGVTTVGDGNWGVVINESSNAMIGGAAPGAGNIIGDQLYGITLSGSGTTGNRVQGNKVGVGSDGVTPRGCPGSGISLARNANGNQIGGILPGEGNIVAYNGARYGYGGVTFSYAVNGNSVLGNSIHSNEGLGIRLGLSNFGVPIANDPGDADTGENNWQNHPVLTFAGTDATATATSVTGVLDSQPSQPYRVEFFVNDDCDPMGHGEGREFLTAINVTTDELGRAPLVVTLPTVIAAGRIITATATDNAGNTSEFGPCRTVTVASADIAVTPGALSFGPALANGGSTTFTLMVRNQGTLPLNFIGPGFTFDGPDADQFALAGTPSIAALAPGASRAVGVVFAPTRVGLVSARLVVTSDDPADPEIRVALAGTGVATAAEVPRPYDGASTGTSTIGPAGFTIPISRAHSVPCMTTPSSTIKLRALTVVGASGKPTTAQAPIMMSLSDTTGPQARESL